MKHLGATAILVALAAAPASGLGAARADVNNGVTPQATAGDVLPAQPVASPVDPVIEEPLRPLFPVQQGPSLVEAARCGPMGLAMLPVGLMLLSSLRLSRFRAR